MTKKAFNEFRFSGLYVTDESNKYFRINRVSLDENKVIVNIGEDHLIKTRFGYALILDSKHVVFLKDWQVDCNWFGIEVLLTKEYFKVKEWGDFSDNFDDSEDFLTWESWLNAAREQENA